VALAGVIVFAVSRPSDRAALSPADPGSVGGDRPAAAKPTYRGSLDVYFWDARGKRRGTLRDALPLRPGDLIRLEARVAPAAYLYLLWIDTEGKVTPIYPWRGKWDRRPAEEAKREHLELPRQADACAKVPPKGRGMETIILLARPERLPRDVDLERLLAALPPQHAYPAGKEDTAVWFQGGQVVRDEPERDAPDFYAQGDPLNDPLLGLQAMLRERLQPWFPFSRAVAFAKKGEPTQK
jgi:hypothetical protein